MQIKDLSLFDRATKHLRVMSTSLAASETDVASPPFIILFINSICNLKCEHCFYWQNLNSRDDLSLEDILRLARQLGRIENLNLSGGEPFIRKEFAEICNFFIDNNHVREIYVPTSGYFTEKTVNALTEILRHKESSLKYFVCELSLDGTQEFHNKFRGDPKSFQKAMDTYDALVELQKTDERLRIHTVACATADNLDEIRRLADFLWDRCPQLERFNLAVIRGDRKNPSLEGPSLEAYEALWEYVRKKWEPRQGKIGLVDPVVQWAKMETIKERTQVIPCKAGVLTGVIYSNGDVASCEALPAFGNIRQNSFQEIWAGQAATARRQSIQAKECYCTTEIFLYPSVTYQPHEVAKAYTRSKLNLRPPGPTHTHGPADDAPTKQQ